MSARIGKALAMLRQLPGAAWRLGRRGRLLYAARFLARVVWRHGPANAALELAQHLAQDAPYADWIAQHDTLNEAETRCLQSVLAALPSQPLISLLMPTYNSPERWLREAVDSIRTQLYPHWQLCLVDDASTAPHVRPILEALAREDSRIRLRFRSRNGHISAASNDALVMADGEFVGLVDHDDLLAPHALAMVAIELASHPEADLIYSDEDKIDLDGRRFGPYFKPDWSPDLMRCQNMISHFGVYRTSLARQVGGFRLGYEGSQDWDLALRVIDASAAGRIRHLPYVLYHWRTVPGSTSTSVDAKSYAIDAAQKAVEDHLARLGLRAEADHLRHGHLRIHYALPEVLPRVSVVVALECVKDGQALWRHFADWIGRAGMPIAEIILSGPAEAMARAANLPSVDVRLLAIESGPGIASRLREGAARADGDVLVFLSPQLRPQTEGWLAELVAHALRSGTGAVGACLAADASLRSAGGYILGAATGTAVIRNPDRLPGRDDFQQNLSAISAACLVVLRKRYIEVGGLDAAAFPDRWADVDFCLRLRQLGYWNVWAPHVVLSSRQPFAEHTPNPRDGKALLDRWPTWFASDPAYNPNLSLTWPIPTPGRPRHLLPWRVENHATVVE
jgi:GT2 family glycosyltransferase